MKQIKKGDVLNIKSTLTGESYIFTGIIDRMSYGGLPCVFLATDLSNKNTYARFTQQTLYKNGYVI